MFVLNFMYTGVGIFVEESRDIRLRSVSNNTALRWSRHYQLDIYCYSNSTEDLRASIVSPSGIEYFNGGNRFVVEQLRPSGLRFYKPNNYYYISSGIYTCRMVDSHGKMLEISFGLYSSSIG